MLYPPIAPYALHEIAVGGPHTLYVEEVGDPAGIPVVFLHGGPGAGLAPFMRRFFDPARYRVVLFEQRGAGRSTPVGSLQDNTTWHLVSDIEVIREALGIARWLVFGGSWGSTLALAYAQAFPEQVLGLILRGVLLMRNSELRWFYQGGLRALQPAEWEQFVAVIPPAERDDVLGAYHRRLTGADPGEAAACADAWMRWEAVNASLLPDATSLPVDSRLAAARILVHYMVNGAFLRPETQLLDGVELIRRLPAVIVQGRYDLCCPPVTAYELSRRWPEADLRMIEGAGHTALEPGIANALVEATDAFAASDRGRFR